MLRSLIQHLHAICFGTVTNLERAVIIPCSNKLYH